MQLEQNNSVSTTTTEQLSSIYAGTYPADEVIWNILKEKEVIEAVYASKILQAYKERYGDDVHLHGIEDGHRLHKGRTCQLKKELPNGDLIMDETILATKDYNPNTVYSYEVYYSKNGIKNRHLK